MSSPLPLPSAMGLCTPGPGGRDRFLNAARIMRDCGDTRADISTLRAWAIRGAHPDGWKAATAAALRGLDAVEPKESRVATLSRLTRQGDVPDRIILPHE
jgi:hypothetical protein